MPRFLRQPRRCAAARLRRVYFESLEDRCLLAATITVNSTADSDLRDAVLTLREAILVNNRALAVSTLTAAEQAQVSGTPASDDRATIAFDIPGGGVRTIRPTSTLPAITDAAIVDGYTQPGAGPNTNPLLLGPGALGSNAVLLIEISAAGSGGDGLVIHADDTTVRGLAINGFGIQIRVTANTPVGHRGIVVEGNFLGTNPAGTAAAGTSTIGVHFAENSTDSRVGGTTPSARNVIAGFTLSGIQMEVAAGMVIQGNLIGTNAAGTAAIGGGNYGVRFMTSSGENLVGGIEPGAGNLISGSDEGFSTSNGPQGGPTGFDRLQGNFVGTDVTGTASIPNRYGVRLTGSAGGLVGGADADDGILDGNVRARNLISGNEIFGIWLAGSGFTIQGNWIGTDSSGLGPLGNGGSGIDGLTSFSTALIGGTTPLAGNVIAFNGLVRGGDGIRVPSGTGIAILGNSFFSNAELGIDLRRSLTEGAPGVTMNDEGDSDTGPNNLQNFPAIVASTLVGGTLRLEYLVPSTTAHAAYPLRVEFFKADSHGQEGQLFLGSDIYDAARASTLKTIAFAAGSRIANGDRVVATATDANNNTSEFSSAAVVRDGAAAVNFPPSGGDRIVTVGEDRVYTVSVTDFEFSDLDAQPNAFQAAKIVSLPANGLLTNQGVAVTVNQFVTVAAIASGQLQYTPPANAHGNDLAQIAFQVQDDGGTANGGADLDPTPNTLTIRVSSVNDPPEGMDRQVTIFEDASFLFSNSLFQILDPQDSPPHALRAIKFTTIPSVGLLTFDSQPVVPGQFVAIMDIDELRYTPPADATGSPLATFLFQHQDNGDTVNGGVDLDPTPNTFSITVRPVNDSPIGTDDFLVGTEDRLLIIEARDLLANDGDIDGDALSVSGLTQPRHGTLRVESDGALHYLPENDFSGLDSFTYRVSDGQATGNVATVGIDVRPVNDGPVIVLATEAIVVTEGQAFLLAGSFLDPDQGDAWVATVDFGDGRGEQPLSLLPNKSFEIVHSYPDDGHFVIAVRVVDRGGLGQIAGATVDVVNAVPERLTLSGPAEATVGQQIVVSGSFFDRGTIDTFTGEVDWGDGQRSVFAIPANDRAFSAAHTYSAAGRYTVTARIRDDDGGIATQATVITVEQKIGTFLINDTLQISGSPARDNIAVSLSGGRIVVNATYGQVNSNQSFPRAAVKRITASLRSGDDSFRVDARLSLPIYVDAGAGNDKITAGSGRSIIVGGAGNDLLYGGAGRDVLIGGSGKDQLWGFGGSDLLIAGSTVFDQDSAALAAILGEWSSGRSLNARLANLRSGSGPILAGSGIYLERPETVFDDTEVDLLMGGADGDWFLWSAGRDLSRDRGKADRST